MGYGIGLKSKQMDIGHSRTLLIYMHLLKKSFKVKYNSRGENMRKRERETVVSLTLKTPTFEKKEGVKRCP